MIIIFVDPLSPNHLYKKNSMQKKDYLPIGNSKDILIEPREVLDEEDLLTILRQCGLKVTLQRLAILKVLNAGARAHMTAQDILDEVRKEFQSIGFATIYRFLKQLTKFSIISEISMGNASSRYELKSKNPHYHIACAHCDKIIEFKNKTIEKILKNIVKEHGFTMKHQLLEIYVNCGSKKCKEKEKKA